MGQSEGVALRAVGCTYENSRQVIYVADTGNNRVVKLQASCHRPGYSPLHVCQLSKAALWTGDTDRALTFVAEASRERYAVVYEQLGPHLQDMVEGMGDMVLHSQEPGCIRYDILHDHDGQTLKFPAFFIKEADGNWKIWNF